MDLRKGRKYQTAEENCIMRCFKTWAFQDIKVIKRSMQDGHVARNETREMLTNFRTGKPNGRNFGVMDKDGKCM